MLENFNALLLQNWQNLEAIFQVAPSSPLHLQLRIARKSQQNIASLLNYWQTAEC
jgi:hypothetical protein